MGVYFNPKNGSFTGDKNSRIYVDKTSPYNLGWGFVVGWDSLLAGR